MCGGPPASHTKMTDVSGTRLVALAAAARIRITSGKLSPLRPKTPILSNDRREAGPGQRLEFIVGSPIVVDA